MKKALCIKLVIYNGFYIYIFYIYIYTFYIFYIHFCIQFLPTPTYGEMVQIVNTNKRINSSWT
jgi:hypothetical protein